MGVSRNDFFGVPSDDDTSYEADPTPGRSLISRYSWLCECLMRLHVSIGNGFKLLLRLSMKEIATLMSAFFQ
jgi:hypothetical protein